MPIVILALPDDRPALRLAAVLKARYGSEHVALIAGDVLILARRWLHRIENGRVRSEVQLADGQCLTDVPGSVIVNRLCQISLPHFARAKPADRDYAASELQALLLSWLHALRCPIYNRPSPAGLAGPDFGQLQWLMYAAKAGLPVRRMTFTTNGRRSSAQLSKPYRAAADLICLEPLDPAAAASGPLLYCEDVTSPPESVLIVGDRIVGALPTGLAAPCRDFARSIGCDLLQLWLAQSRDSGEAVVVGVSAFPDFSGAGDLEAVCDLLAEGAKLAPRAA